jgi:hypothetical protein
MNKKNNMNKEKIIFENVELNKDQSLKLLRKLANNELTNKDLESLFNHSEVVTYINENGKTNENE